MSERSEAYLAGYNCGYTKPDTKNCNHKYFSTKFLMEEWTKGKADGEKDKAEKDTPEPVTVIYHSKPSCPNCGSQDIQERAGSNVCFKCGHYL